MSNQLNQHKVLNNTLELDIFNSQITQVTKLLNVKFTSCPYYNVKLSLVLLRFS